MAQTKRKRKAKRPENISVRKIQMAIRQAKTQKDLDRCEEMLGNITLGRSYLLGEIGIMRDLVETISTIETCYNDNPNMVVTQCMHRPIEIFRNKMNVEPYEEEAA